jgi:glycosyltransferase involved in cell wall biosynthesis
MKKTSSMIKKSKIKILRIQSRICIGGPALHTELLSKYLPTSEYSTLLLGGAIDEGEFSKLEELLAKGFRVACITQMRRDINLINDTLALIALYRIIRRERPQIVCTHTAKAGAVGRTAAFLAGVPLIFHTFHGHAFKGYFSRPKTFIFLMIERILARFTDRIVAICPTQLQELTEKYHVAPANRFQVVRLGFELEPFFRLRRDAELKHRLGLAEKDILIGVVGRLVPIKNLTAALNIIKELAAKDDRFHLCIIGDGPERSTLEALGQALNIERHVHFTGWMRNMMEVYAGIDLLLLTSLNEGTPVTIIEAMAVGIPVISSRVGGVPDLITEGVSGLMFDLNEETAAVEKIRQLVEQKELQNTMTHNAREFVREQYCYPRMIREMDALYKHHLQKWQ